MRQSPITVIPMPIRHLALTLMICCLPIAQDAGAMPAPDTCGPPGQWLLPPASAAASVQSTPAPELLDRLAKKQVVLLGESHACADDHRWQYAMLTALWQRHPDMAIGFEMFPRRLQPVLDRWVAGQLNEQEFLKEVDWDQVWGYDARLYLPLFQFARQHGLPMLALNVDRGLVKEVRTRGWEGVPAAQREGVGRPAAPQPPYRQELKTIFDLHPMLKDKSQDEASEFAHFVEAQTLWDRAMAEGIASYRQAHPHTLVVGILGSGHLQHGYGVPHQLQSLGDEQVANLMTMPSDHACADITPGLADAVFVIPPQPELAPVPPPRLGVALRPIADGVMIEKVMPQSLAEKTGLKDGDVILQAAGNKVSSIEEVRDHVQRQPAGTWLPLLIRRGGLTQEIVVRFPASPEPPPPHHSLP
jgi:uncharacterized iron-regulated protein